MDDDMKRILDKLDKIDEKQGEMNVTLERLTVTVEVHEKRSTALEEMHQKHLVDDAEQHKEMQEKIDTIDSFIDKIKGSWKLILITSVLVGLAAGIIKIYGG